MDFSVLESRHSVREFLDKPLPSQAADALRAEIEACNRESGLHIQLVTDEPGAFDGFMAHYGKFSGVSNYIALIGKKGPDLQERIGYFGERLALRAQELGLNTCWVALTFSKRKCRAAVAPGEKLVCVLALGFGRTSGVPHRSKPAEQLCDPGQDPPAWFTEGVRWAMLAPTAMNQQKFFLARRGDRVRLTAGRGFYTRVDLGIVRYHFELGAGTDRFSWEK